jgi:hypothetical protein
MEKTTTSDVSWLQEAMKKGFILGAVHIFIFILIYFLAPSKLTGFSYLLTILGINIGYCIYQGIQWRNETGGFMGYGAAFKYAFMILLFNGLLNTVFVVIFLFIDPTFPDTMAQSQLDTSVYWAEKFGAPEETVEKMQENFNPEDITKQYTPLGLLKSVGIVSIFYAIGALIIALFVKKNEPEVM